MTVRDSFVSIAPVAAGEILVVDDDPAALTAMLHHVATLSFATLHAERGRQAVLIATARASTLDCILLDVTLPDIDGWEVQRQLRADPETAQIPVVLVLDAVPTEAVMLRIIESGAVDHIVKPVFVTLLCAKVRAVAERARAQRELRSRLSFALEHAAQDALTKLFNRRYFERRLREEIAHARRHRRPFAVVMIDLDHFKLVNDTYGHTDGDRVLLHVAQVIQAELREDDVACRYGGEEFVILLRATTGAAGALVANRILAGLSAKPIAVGSRGEVRHVTFSGGVAAADESNQYNADDILSRADGALYRAKRAGRNRVEVT